MLINQIHFLRVTGTENLSGKYTGDNARLVGSRGYLFILLTSIRHYNASIALRCFHNDVRMMFSFSRCQSFAMFCQSVNFNFSYSICFICFKSKNNILCKKRQFIWTIFLSISTKPTGLSDGALYLIARQVSTQKNVRSAHLSTLLLNLECTAQMSFFRERPYWHWSGRLKYLPP